MAGPPGPVPNPDEKEGGLGVGLASSPRKNKDATETNTREHDVNGARNEEPQTLEMMTDSSQTQPGAGILKTQRMALIMCGHAGRGLSK